MTEELRVDPAVLHGVAGGVDILAGDMAVAADALEKGCAELASRLPGWALGAAVAGAGAGVWREDCGVVRHWTGEYAEGLRKAARDYEVGDQVNGNYFPVW